MIHFVVTVLNTAELLATEAYGAGALLRWESAPTIDGTYAEGGTDPLVSGTTLYDVWDAAGDPGTPPWYRTRVSNAGGTSFSSYSAAVLPVPSLVTIAEVRALVRSRLSDVDLQAIIDREEAWLASGIGALTGERTETFSPGNGPLYIRRLTDSVVVTDNGTAVASTAFLFTPSTGELRRVVYWVNDPPRHDLVAWQGDVTVTYTPADEAAVKRAVIELVRLTVGETGMQSETLGDYQYDRGTGAGRPSRPGLVRSILIRRPAYSMRLRSGWEAS